MCLFCTSSTTNRLFTQIGVMAVNLLGALWSPRRSQTGSNEVGWIPFSLLSDAWPFIRSSGNKQLMCLYSKLLRSA